MSRDKLGLFVFGLVLLGFVIFVKTGSALLFSLGILSADATLRDVVIAVREDEAKHRDVNHEFASEYDH